MKKIWLAYLDDNGKRVTGYFKCSAETMNYIKIQSGENTLTIPYHRILKIKEHKE